ncbi:MAG: adenylate kinase family protein [Haloglomus sp.]
MRVAVTGTPGTGKTTATALLAERSAFDFEVVHLNDVVRERDLAESTDEGRDSLVVDPDAVREWLDETYAADADLLVESHLAHLLDSDRVVVLRAHPERIRQRLLERGETERSASENAESEALDVVLSETVDRHGTESVFEVDTTDRPPEAVADEIAAVVRGERDPEVGVVEFTDYLVGETASEEGERS